MDYYKDIIQEIREDWFADHEAKITMEGRLTTIRWGKPDSGNMSIRYVFDGNYIYVSGDMGEAVFELTELAILDKIAKYSIDYFMGKLRCAYGGVYDFLPSKAAQEIQQNLNIDNVIDDEYETRRNLVKTLIEEAEDANSVNDWRYVIDCLYDDLDEDSEWLYDCGNVYRKRLLSYFVGLKMCWEQLNL